MPPRRWRPRQQAPQQPGSFQSTGPRFCDAAILTDDGRYPMCEVRLPRVGPRFCPQHVEECVESLDAYKDAARRAEGLQSRVFAVSRKNRAGKFNDLQDIREAIRTTEEYIHWATKELDGRRSHAKRFYAYEVKSDPGHTKRMANIEKLIRIARVVFNDLNYREDELILAARSPEEREQELREVEAWQQQYMSSSPERAAEPLSLNCFTIRAVYLDEEPEEAGVIAKVEFKAEEEEELDESALGETMDEEEELADRREELQVLEMLRWYSRRFPTFATRRAPTRARDDSVNTLANSMRDLNVLEPD
ncbi:hypothetical protein C8T65DRAFT_671543 [Cerioporus squamosus]|nr:hypothetical protein C8T65DRAFT_671543 [Cerioporus squamosus]